MNAQITLTIQIKTTVPVTGNPDGLEALDVHEAIEQAVQDRNYTILSEEIGDLEREDLDATEWWED